VQNEGAHYTQLKYGILIFVSVLKAEKSESRKVDHFIF
jgi:hypothetical protein